MIDPHGMTGDTLEIRRQPFPHIHQYAVWIYHVNGHPDARQLFHCFDADCL